MRNSEAPNANSWSDEILMPFDQNSQAQIPVRVKIVGTKIESVGESDKRIRGL